MKNSLFTNKTLVGSVPIISSNFSQFIQKLSNIPISHLPVSILTCTTYGLYRSTQNNLLRKALTSASAVVPDGMPLVWILKRKYPQSQRIYGPDIILSLCQALQHTNHSHYFYGSTNQTLKALTKNLTQKFPNITIAGSCAPGRLKVGQLQTLSNIKKISKTKPDVVWVSLGEEKQDIWIHLHKKYFPSSVIIGVGAAFDFLAKTKRQAPPFIQKIGLEWLFRFVHEPRRLWKRYFLSILFLIKYIFKST